MAPYDEWNRIEEEEEEELQDTSWLEGKRDVILFCIDCSESMLDLYEDPEYEDAQTCHLFTALDAAMQIQKKKIIVGPNDQVGIMLFNTTRRGPKGSQGSDIKKGTYLYQPIGPLSAPSIQELIQLLNAFREDNNTLREEFPPVEDKYVAMGDVFTSANWILRDGAPKTATKRVFLITNQDNPHPGQGSRQLLTSARTTLVDLAQSGVAVEPFFISTEDKPFDVSKFYRAVLLPNNLVDDDEDHDPSNPSVLNEAISISRIEDLLAQMRFHEVPKRAQFSIPLELGQDFVIGVKGYGLVTEQKKGAYRYFAETENGIKVAESRTLYVNALTNKEIDKTKVLFGMDLGGDKEAAAGKTSSNFDPSVMRLVKAGERPFYTAEEVKKFRTLGLEPGIKLLGFKDADTLAFEDNIKHSHFIYPDELAYSGSKRTFSALLKSLIKKNKIGLVRVLTRRNATPTFCAMVPQMEQTDDAGWTEPAGFHLIPLPFADDIRQATVEKGLRAGKPLTEAAMPFIHKITIKRGGYPPDSYPNPALAYHNEQLQASAFREEYDPSEFEDQTLPAYDSMHKKIGSLIKTWKEAFVMDDSADVVEAPPAKAGTKRKADTSVDEAEIRAKYDNDTMSKLRVDQLKEFLKSKSLPVSGKKADLIDRVSEYFDKKG
ncbi:ku70-like protein [Schizophyllum commune Tattone D]|nr:ku70-like protein [Schizophyllum commune Tattone D]